MRLLVAMFWFMAFHSGSQAQQYEQITRLPPFRDFVQVQNPQGFKHGYEKGFLTNLVQEYIPENETVKAWTKMLSVSALGSRERLPPKDAFLSLMKDAMSTTCRGVSLDVISENDLEILYRSDCTMRAGTPLVGSVQGTREIGLYRIRYTEEAVYQIHYSWHGDDDALANRDKREAFFTEGAAALDNVFICDMKSEQPCEGVDFYVLGKAPQELKGSPPCRTSKTEQCNPAALFVATPKDGEDSDKETALSIIRVDETDLADVSTANKIAGNLKAVLESGQKITLLVRGPTPDHLPTPDERATIATFFSFLRTVLTATRAADPDSIAISFLNFR